MSAKVDKSLTVKRYKSEKIVVNFDAERLKAPFLLRCGAVMVDYIILVMVPVFGFLMARSFGLDGTKLLNGEISNTSWLIMFLLGVTNLLILPLFSGQTIGKMLTGLKIVDMEGNQPSFYTLILRNTIGYLIILFSFGLSFFLSIFSSKGRALHDFIFGTVVIYGKQKILSADSNNNELD